MALWSGDPVEQARLKSRFFRRRIFWSNQAGENGSSRGWCELHDMAETAAGH